MRDLLNPSSEVTAGWSQPNGRLPSLAIREAVGKGVYVDGQGASAKLHQVGVPQHDIL